jgi:hypothetical protein
MWYKNTQNSLNSDAKLDLVFNEGHIASCHKEEPEGLPDQPVE